MLEELLNLVKQQSGDAIINNPAVPNEHNEAVIAETSNSIAGGLQGMMAQGGGLTDILKMFGGQDQGTATNNITQQLSGGVIQNLMSKFGLNSQAAGGIASSLIPIVLGKLVSKTHDSNDSSFNIQSIFNSFSGGQTSGMDVSGLLSKVQSGAIDLNGDGHTDVQDLLSAFSGNSNNSGGGGGILDKLKGMLGG
jgi:hypothetical protein